MSMQCDKVVRMVKCRKLRENRGGMSNPVWRVRKCVYEEIESEAL